MIEAVIKISGFGWTFYFKSAWNKFDFFLVLASLLDLTMTSIGSSKGSGVFNILRSAPPPAVLCFAVLQWSRLSPRTIQAAVISFSCTSNVEVTFQVTEAASRNPHFANVETHKELQEPAIPLRDALDLATSLLERWSSINSDYVHVLLSGRPAHGECAPWSSAGISCQL